MSPLLGCRLRVAVAYHGRPEKDYQNVIKGSMALLTVDLSSWVAHNARGGEYLETKTHDQAEEHLDPVVLLEPRIAR